MIRSLTLELSDTISEVEKKILETSKRLCLDLELSESTRAIRLFLGQGGKELINFSATLAEELIQANSEMKKIFVILPLVRKFNVIFRTTLHEKLCIEVFDKQNFAKIKRNLAPLMGVPAHRLRITRGEHFSIPQKDTDLFSYEHANSFFFVDFDPWVKRTDR